MDVVLEDGRIASIFICRENNNGITVNIFGKEISNIKGLTSIVPGLTVSARNYLEKAESYTSFVETVNQAPLPTGRQSLGYFVSPKGVYCKAFQLDDAGDPFALDFMQLVFHLVSGYFDVKGLNAGEEFIMAH